MTTAADKRQDLTRQAVSAFQSGDSATADRLFRKLATDKRADAQSFYNYGIFLRRSGRPADAIYWLNRCLRNAPDRADARIERGLALSDQGELTSAVDDLAAFPRDPVALHALANIQTGLGQWAEAKTSLSILQSLEAWTEADGLLMVRLLLETGQVDDAHTLCRSLRAANPNLAPSLLKSLGRRSKGRLSLDETRLARLIGDDLAENPVS